MVTRLRAIHAELSVECPCGRARDNMRLLGVLTLFVQAPPAALALYSTTPRVNVAQIYACTRIPTRQEQ